jgi:hypothetical protein
MLDSIFENEREVLRCKEMKNETTKAVKTCQLFWDETLLFFLLFLHDF